MRISQEEKYDTLYVMDLINDLSVAYRDIYWLHVDGEIYIYKPVGRRDYLEIINNEDLDECDKEDAIIKSCLLYPEVKDINLDEMPPGKFQKILKHILENSYLDSVDSRVNILNYYRQEMFLLENQIPCIINEAFPNYDIEEIENWGVEQTAKFLSRAEFKLQNFRNMQIDTDAIDNANALADVSKQGSVEDTSNNSKTLTLDKLKEIEKFKTMFPEFDLSKEVTSAEQMERETKTEDTEPPALRIGW